MRSAREVDPDSSRACRDRRICKQRGLSIARSIVQAHGGRIWAEANPRGGATFRFTLPAAERAAVAPTDASPAVHRQQAEPG